MDDKNKDFKLKKFVTKKKHEMNSKIYERYCNSTIHFDILLLAMPRCSGTIHFI